MSENVQACVTEKETQPPVPEKQVKLVDVDITNQNIALNVIFSFVALGQQRGVFNIQESAKIWECIKLFRPEQPNTNVVEKTVEQAVEQVVEQAVEEGSLEATD